MAGQAEAIEYLTTVVRGARKPLQVTGAGSRLSYGEPVAGAIRADAAMISGILDYEPSELYVRVAAGTPQREVAEALAAEGQELCGDPHATEEGTVGGAYSCGIAGPRRVSHGDLRDHVLGCQLIDGSGKVLRFGGNVIKNVAGYDVSRLAVGALGTLGIVTELSLRVRGLPERSATVSVECAAADAARKANEAVARGMPVAATSWEYGVLRVLLEGGEAAVSRAARELGGNEAGGGRKHWEELRDHRTERFAGAKRVWMCHLPPLAELPFDDHGLIEWLGARRWFFDDAPVALREVVAEAGGSAVLYRRPEEDRIPVFPVPGEIQLGISRRLKRSFDPKGLLNPGRFGYL